MTKLESTLTPAHLADLRGSGLSDETIAACGFYSEDHPLKLSGILQRRYPKSRGGALVFPFRDHNGALNGFKRVKPDNPRKDRNGRPVKYESPAGLGNRVFIPPNTVHVLDDPKSELLITEGEKKAAKADQEGFPCLGLVGVYGWKNGKKADRLIPDLEAIAWRGRPVYLVFDSDLNEKPEVREAESRLAAQLINRGAKVKVGRLPDGPNGEKVGLDDYLVAHDGMDLRRLLDKAEDPDPVTDDVKVKAAELDAMPEARRFLSQVCAHTEGKEVVPTLRFYRDCFYGWDGQKFREFSDSEIRCRVLKYLDHIASHLSKGAADRLLACVQSEILIDHWNEMPTWIGAGDCRHFVAMQNGLLDLQGVLRGDKDVLHPHSPRWFSTIALPYRFDPTAACPTWLAFLERNLEEDRERINFLQEWFGYCLVSDTSQQKFVVFEGEGANGKSVACAVLTALLGVENVSNVPLEAFGGRFQLTSTLGKLANICAEVGELDRAAEGFLKAFTSGDRMTFDRKMKPAIEAAPTARLVLATNNRPNFSDRSGGLWRRMVLVPWRVTIPDAEQVLGMDKPEWWDASGELPGIFCWAVAGLFRLRQQKKFTQSDVCREAVNQYRVESNPARRFLTEHYETDLNSESFVQAADVYKAYREWCGTNGYMPLGEHKFGQEVMRAFPHSDRKQRRIIGERKWCYIGIQPEA